MKIFLKRLWRPGFSTSQRQMIESLRLAVEAWVRDKGFMKDLSGVHAIAADIGVRQDLLCRYIRAKSGKPLLVWRKELRIMEAQQLLLDYPELPVATVGQMVGIDDKSNFRRQFTEQVGMSPREWRERGGR